MFWLARAMRLARPIPPTPTPAMFRMSLGGVNPRPSTCLGTIMSAAPEAAVRVRNSRRDVVFLALIPDSPGTGDIIPCLALVCDHQLWAAGDCAEHCSGR